MQDEDGKKEMMLATHDGKTIIACPSLQDEIYELRQALKFTRWVMWPMVALTGFNAAAFCVLVWLKFPTLVMIWQRLTS